MSRTRLAQQFREEATLLWPEPIQWLYAFCKRYLFFCLVVVSFAFFWYVKSYYHKQELAALESQKIELLNQIEAAKEEREELSLQLNSASDLSWQELTLMRVLGVKPEGYTKVIFR